MIPGQIDLIEALTDVEAAISRALGFLAKGYSVESAIRHAAAEHPGVRRGEIRRVLSPSPAADAKVVG